MIPVIFKTFFYLEWIITNVWKIWSTLQLQFFIFFSLEAEKPSSITETTIVTTTTAETLEAVAVAVEKCASGVFCNGACLDQNKVIYVTCIVLYPFVHGHANEKDVQLFF